MNKLKVQIRTQMHLINIILSKKARHRVPTTWLHVLNVQNWVEQSNTIYGLLHWLSNYKTINKSKKMITIKVNLVVPSWEEEKECDLERIHGMLTTFYFLSDDYRSGFLISIHIHYSPTLCFLQCFTCVLISQ